MIDEKITPGFWLSEFLQSDTATRLGVDNTPDAAALANIRTLLAPGMQSVRDCLGQPVFISSGYRSPAVNRAVGGAANPPSQHTTGQAADFKCPAFGLPITLARYLVAHGGEVHFDQLICEGTWVHISFSPKPRGHVLTAHFGPGGTTYTRGLA
jgi:zinc D-Ala-D-Ala carboxypeptidase